MYQPLMPESELRWLFALDSIVFDGTEENEVSRKISLARNPSLRVCEQAGVGGQEHQNRRCYIIICIANVTMKYPVPKRYREYIIRPFAK